jgi:hypothetical protein
LASLPLFPMPLTISSSILMIDGSSAAMTLKLA